MYLSEVERLARYLTRPALTIPDVCQFLVLETFRNLKPSALLATEITEDGFLTTIGHFGLNRKSIQDWGNISLSDDLPFTAAVKRDEIILVEPSALLEDYPALEKFDGIPESWDSHLICPVLPFGVFSLTLNSVPKIDSEFELFIRTAGALATLHFTKIIYKVEHFNHKGLSNGVKKLGELSTRQLLIKSLVEKGFSNPAIAEEIGYSESLVRQETMAIYSILNVSGRKELLEAKSK
jgi:DNA-binding CsgD family transcriptional regulator